MKPVRMYTTPICPYCVRAKALLSQRGVIFEEIKVADDDDAMWDELAKRSGLKTLPLIYAGDRLIGAYSDLAKLDAQDQLASLKV